jgi:hypothetical protein
MEIEALRKMIPRWKNNPNIVGPAHDQDAKASALIEESGWKVKEYKDPIHMFKSNFERLYKKWNMHEWFRGRPATERRRKRLGLTGSKEGLRHHR